MKVSLLLGVFFCGVFFAVNASPAVLVDRGLPNSTNVNNEPNPNRSNVDWLSGITDSGNYYLVGDDFSLLGPAIIDSITVYTVSNTPIGGANATPDDEFSSLTLYYGLSGALNLTATAHTAQLVTYQPGGENYQGSGGTFYSIYAVKFSGLNWNVNAGTFGFALDAVPVGGSSLYLHASNAALSGTPQAGADNLFRYYILSAGTATFDSFCDTGDALTCGGWDKSSDINVLVEGTNTGVPEPSTVTLLGIGLSGVVLFSRRHLARARS